MTWIDEASRVVPMYWNHRVMRQHFAGTGEVSYGIREVFYGDDGTVESWTAVPMDPHGETVGELRADLARMLACLDRPVLDEADELRRIEFGNKTKGDDDA